MTRNRASSSNTHSFLLNLFSTATICSLAIDEVSICVNLVAKACAPQAAVLLGYYNTSLLSFQRNLFKFDFNNTNKMDSRVINIDPEILGGTPVFYGTRVPIKNLFDYLETGESIETFLQDFDGVKKEQVIKLLEMSQKLIETSTEILNENFA